jgi:ribosomal protein L44E
MRKPQLTRWIFGAWLVASVGVAAAQTTVYRCGPDGRTFSEKPCGDGVDRAMGVSDARTAAEREAAHEVAHREARTADSLARDNRRFERSLRPGGAISLSGSGKADKPAKPAKPAGKADDKAHKPKTSKPSAPEGFTAVVPGSEPKKPRRRS